MILVDSNVILDVVQRDPAWGDWARSALSDASDRDEIAINPIIYAEVSVSFSTIERLEAAIGALDFRRLPLPYEAGFLAGKAFTNYRRRGGARPSPLPDFYIGAHAAIVGMSLLTRDPRGYRSYFPSVPLIAPGRV